MDTKKVDDIIQSRFPDANYKIIAWDGYTTHPITIKCLDCGEEKTYTRIHALSYKRKTCFCTNCKNNGLTKSQKKALTILKEHNFEFIRWADTIDESGKVVFRVEFKCPNCHQITNRRVWELLHTCQECSQCSLNSRTQKTNDTFLWELHNKYGNEYEPLEPYTKAREKIKVRHNKCGFIYSVSPDNLLRDRGCPHCKRYNSKGCRKIKAWFEQNGISYEVEKNFEWIGNKRYDFFVPQDNLLIEFNGIQHYQPIEFFLHSRTFEQQQESDRIKQEQAIAHGYKFLVISYEEEEQIPQILSNSTTIPKKEVDSSESKE